MPRASAGALAGPAAPPPLSAPATIVQLSDAVFARQRGVMPGRARPGRGQQRLSSAEAARAHAEATSTAVRNDPIAAAAAQANMPAERAFALLFE